MLGSLAWDTAASGRYIARNRVREQEWEGARRVVEHEETRGWWRRGEREPAARERKSEGKRGGKRGEKAGEKERWEGGAREWREGENERVWSVLR